MYLDHLKAIAEFANSKTSSIQYYEILEDSLNEEELESEFSMALLKMEYYQKIGSEGFGDAAASAAEKVKDLILKLIELAGKILSKVKDFVITVFKKIFQFISSVINLVIEKATGTSGGNGLSEVRKKVKEESDPASKFKLIANYLESVKLFNPKGKIYSFETLDIDKIADEGIKSISDGLDSSQISNLKNTIKGMYKKERVDKSKINKRIIDDLGNFNRSCQSLASDVKKALKEIDVNTIKREAEQNPEDTDKMAAYRAALSVINHLNKFVGNISKDSMKVGTHAANVYAKMRMPQGATGDCEVIFFDFDKFLNDYIKPSFELVSKAKDTTSKYITSLRASNDGHKEMLENYRKDIINILHEDFTKSSNIASEAGLSSIFKSGGALVGISLLLSLCSALGSSPYGVNMTDAEIRNAKNVMESIEQTETSLHNQAQIMVQMASQLDASNADIGDGDLTSTSGYYAKTEHGSSFVYGTNNPDNVNGGMVKAAIDQVQKDIQKYKSLMDSTWSDPVHGDGTAKTMMTKSFKNSVERFSPQELDSLSSLVSEAQSALDAALRK